MAGRKAKGVGGAGCCCGGCRSVPNDREAATTEIQPIQQYCCRCIPKIICIAVTSGYGTQYQVVERICGGSPTDGAPIQYATTVIIDGVSRVFNVRLTVRDEQCYITWDIPDLDLEGERLIDPNELADPYSCNHGMNAAACAEFGGTWEIEDQDLTIVISEPPTLDLKDLVECGGCSCICRCVCFSIYSRSSEGIFTLVGSNDVVCGEVSRTDVVGCEDPEFDIGPWYANWTSHGWNLRLGDKLEHWIATATVVAGTAESTGVCSVSAATWKGDEHEHVINGSDSQVIYDWELSYRIAKSLKWVGRSHDETSSILFEAWDWVTTDWITIGTVDGRPDATDINRAFTALLDPDYTGTGIDEGKVRVRLTLLYGTSMRTNMIRLVTHECCKWTLTPPDTVEFASPPAEVLFTGTNSCPDPSGFWEMTDTSGTDWFVTVGCSWCGSTCGTVATSCCPRPIGNVLFAEVDLDCPTCAATTVVVPLTSDGTGSVWSGEATVCGTPLLVTLSCSGGGWSITVSGAGACSFSGLASSTSCDPLLLEFNGDFAGGIGCCGPFPADPVTSASISIAVIE